MMVIPLIRHGILIVAVGVVALSLMMAAPAHAGEYPTKPISLVVGFSPGGGTDTYARTLATFMHEELGEPMVVVNKLGASGSIAAKFVADQRPDGYTIYLQNAGSLISKALIDGKRSPVSPLKDFQVLGQVGVFTAALFVPINSPFKTISDLVDHAKANPGKLRFSNPGASTMHTLIAESFIRANGLKVVPVPFKGGAKARGALVADQVAFGVLGVQHHRGFESKLRPLAAISSSRDKVMSKIPTVAEAKLPYVDLNGLVMVFASSNVPKGVVTKLQDAIKKVSQLKGYGKILKKAGLSNVYADPATATKQFHQMHALLKPLVKDVFKKK